MKVRTENAVKHLGELLVKPIDKRGRAFFVDKPTSGRRLVITDIHGCYSTFVKLLKKVDLQPEDQLFILGDLIDRGPYSMLVLEKVWELLNMGYKVYPLRGNHEQLFLNFNRETPDRMISFASRQFAQHLLKSSGELFPSVDYFLGQLPIYYETDIAFLVHAGFNTNERNIFESWKDMLWIREFKYDPRKLKGKKIIHGHVPVELQEIQNSLDSDLKKIDLDNGCVRACVPGFGKLVCLDLDSKKLYSQKNADMEPG